MKRSIILVILLVSILPVFPVKAQEGNYWVNLELEEVYGLRGNSINITSTTNYAGSNIRIYDPDENLIYNKDWVANETRAIPISDTASYGTYRIVGRVPSVKTETWFTVLDIAGWDMVTMWPHVVEHQGLEYSFYKNWTVGVRQYDDRLNIDFSTIRKLAKAYDMDITPKYNDMNFRIRFSKGPNVIDLNFAFIHVGAKIIINGTLDHARDLSINVEGHALKKWINSLSAGNIVFDWSDILGGEWWVYLPEEKELIIHAPKNFRIDPVIFSDGYESDFVPWTGTTTGGTGAISIQGAIVHHGSKAQRSQSSAAADTAYAYKNFGDETDVYAKTEFYLDSADMGDSWDYVVITTLRDNGVGPALQIRLQNRADSLPSLVVVVVSPYSTNVLDVDLSYDTWTCIELHFVTDVSEGIVQVWVEEVLKTDLSGLDTSARTVDQVEVGIDSPGATGLHAVDIEVDCVVVAEEYIGPETANTAPVNDGMSISNMDDTDNLYAQYKKYRLDYDGHDEDGYADIDYVLLNITQNTNVRLSLNYSEDENTCSILDGDGEFEYDSFNATRTGNNLNITADFWVEGDVLEEASCELKAYIVDDEPESDTDTLQTDYVDIVNTFVTQSVEFTDGNDPDRVDISSSEQVDFEFRYADDPGSSTPSSLTLPDAEVTSVEVLDEWDNVFGTDSTIVSGQGSVTGTTNASVQSTDYNIRVNPSDGDYATQELTTTEALNTDRIMVYWETLDDARVSVDSNIEGRYRAVLDFDETDLGDGDSLSVSWGALVWDAGNTWFDISHTESSVGAVTVSGWTGSEATYGITAITENITEASYIYDRQQLQSLGANDTTPDPDQPVLSWLTSESEYDAHALTTGDQIELEDNLANVYVYTWNGTMFTNVTSWSVNGTYNVNTYNLVSEATYGITVLHMGGLNLEITVGEVPPPSGYTVNIRVVDAEGAGIQAANVELDNGTLIFDEDTNSTGFIDEQTVQADNYTLTIVKAGYVPYNHSYEILDNIFWIIHMDTLEEGAVVTTTVTFTLELLVLAAVSMIFTLMMLFSSQPGMGVIAGTLAFFFWEATGLFYMYTNIADQWAIGYLFIGLGWICVIMTVYCGLQTLNPKAASRDSAFL